MHRGSCLYYRLDIDIPSEEEDEEAIIERRRQERAAMLERLKLQNQDEDSSRAGTPFDNKREATPDSDAVADEAVSQPDVIFTFTC